MHVKIVMVMVFIQRVLVNVHQVDMMNVVYVMVMDAAPVTVSVMVHMNMVIVVIVLVLNMVVMVIVMTIYGMIVVGVKVEDLQVE
jgi:hypothetical protein